MVDKTKIYESSDKTLACFCISQKGDFAPFGYTYRDHHNGPFVAFIFSTVKKFGRLLIFKSLGRRLLALSQTSHFRVLH